MAEIAINSLIGFADVHVGCQMGLIGPKGGKLDGGGRYKPSNFQRKLYRFWRQFWDEWVPEVTRGEPYGVVNGGDSLEGRHHGTITQWTQNLDSQADAAHELLAPVVAGCEGRYWHLRGTEAHAGPSAEAEEALAERLGAVPEPETGNHARWELWKYVGSAREILTHWLHHISTTSSASYESTAVHKELIEAYQEWGRWNNRPPDVIVRAHRHREFKTEVATARHRGVAIVMPGWQGKTPFTYRLAMARQAIPQFGGILIRLSEEGEPYTRHCVFSIERTRPE